MSLDFGGCGSDVVQVKLHVKRIEINSEPEKLLEEFELEDTWQWIADNSYLRVALQFPEELFHVSTSVCLELQRRANETVKFAVLAEKKYGSCCVDEIGAEHFAADSIVHYGATCLSPHPRLPVRYVFLKKTMEVERFIGQVKSLASNKEELIVVYDVAYHHLRDQMIGGLESSSIRYSCPQIVSPSPRDSLSTNPSSSDGSRPDDEETKFDVILGRKFERTKYDDCRFVYIGADDRLLTTLMIIFNQLPFSLYEPETEHFHPNVSRSSRTLMKRYYMVQKARDSCFVGLLVGTLDVSGYMEVIQKLKIAIKAAGKRCRIYSPGTLNVAKLANLSEFDTYVLVACPLNSMADKTDSYQPIVTPYEMLLACSPTFKWPIDYKLKFEHIISEPFDANCQVSFDVSLLTGRTKTIGVDDDDEKDARNGVLVEKSSSGVLTKSSDFLGARTWQGLQPRFGETPISRFAEGSAGTASGYFHEIQRNSDEF